MMSSPHENNQKHQHQDFKKGIVTIKKEQLANSNSEAIKLPRPSTSAVDYCSTQSNHNDTKDEENIKMSINLTTTKEPCSPGDDESDSSDDETVGSGSDEEGEDEDEEDEEDATNMKDKRTQVTERGEADRGVDDDDDDQYDDCEDEAAGSKALGYVSSDEESEKCVICLCRFLGQTIGTPEVCNHNFCLECIEEWSKQVSACPVDRKIYATILVRREVDGQVIQRINVSADNQIRPAYDDVGPEDVTYCEVCGRCDREDRLLLCDGCDFGFHLECLTPPLDHVPIEDWYCPDCNRVNINPTNQSTSLLNVIAHGIPSEYSLIQRFRRRRMNPEGISEVVRTRINERRRTRGNSDLLTSSMSSSTSNRVVYSAYSNRTSNTATTVSRKKTKRTTKRSTKRKTTKRRTAKRKSRTIRGKKSRRVKRKKRKTSKKSIVRLESDSIRDRIARKLGLKNLRKTPFGLPSFRKAQNHSGCLVKSDGNLNNQRESAGIAQLSLCGAEQTRTQPVADPELYVNEHVNQNDEIEYEHDVGSGAAVIASLTRRTMTPTCAARILAKKASTNSYRTAQTTRRTLPLSRLSQRNEVQSNNFDLLGSILSSQTVLLSNSDQSYVTREGYVRMRPQPMPESRMALNDKSISNLVRNHNDNQQVGKSEEATTNDSSPDSTPQGANTSSAAANNNNSNSSVSQTNNEGIVTGLSSVGISSTLHHQVCNPAKTDKSETPTPEDFVIKKPSPKKMRKGLDEARGRTLDLSFPIESEFNRDDRSDVYSDVEQNDVSDDNSDNEIVSVERAQLIATNDDSKHPESIPMSSISKDLDAQNDSNDMSSTQDRGNQPSNIEKASDTKRYDMAMISDRKSPMCDKNLSEKDVQISTINLVVNPTREPNADWSEGVPNADNLKNVNPNSPSQTSLSEAAVSQEFSQNSSPAVKVKRCKHGRIIVINKDKSKKRDDLPEAVSKEHQLRNHLDDPLKSKKCLSPINTRKNFQEGESQSKSPLKKKNHHHKEVKQSCPDDSNEKDGSRLETTNFDHHSSDDKSRYRREKRKKHHRRSCSRARERDRIRSGSKSRSRSRSRTRRESRSSVKRTHQRSRSKSPRSSKKHRRRSKSSSRSRHRENDRKLRKDSNYRNVDFLDSERFDRRRRSKKSPLHGNEPARRSDYRRGENEHHSRGSNLSPKSNYTSIDEMNRRPYRDEKGFRSRVNDEKYDRFAHSSDNGTSHKKITKISSAHVESESSYSHKVLKESIVDVNDVPVRNVATHSRTKDSNSILGDGRAEIEPKTRNQRDKLISNEPFTANKRRNLATFGPTDSPADQSSTRKLYSALSDEYENEPAKSSNPDYLSRFLPKLGESSLTNMESPSVKITKDSSAIKSAHSIEIISKDAILLSPANNAQSRRAGSVQSLPTPIQDELNTNDLQEKYRISQHHDRAFNRDEISTSSSSMRSNSDIYDPEAPLGPFSPSDSPPQSPFNQSNQLLFNMGSSEAASLIEQLRKMQGKQDNADPSKQTMYDTMTSLLNTFAETNPNFFDTISKLAGNEDSSSQKGPIAMLNKVSGQLSSHNQSSTSSHALGLAKPQSPSTPPWQREQVLRPDDEVPSSAVDLNNKEKYIQKLNRQERVIEEVKLALKPHYQKRAITKEEYKDILRRAVPKICHSKNGEINAVKIRYMVDAYIKKAKHARKKH